MTFTLAVSLLVERLQEAGISLSDANVEARLLVQYVCHTNREVLRMYPDRPLTAQENAHLLSALARREKREPLAYIMGTREFYGMTLDVTPAVLIPRPETEFLVEAILRHASGIPNARIADIGTGSGAIAIAIAQHRPTSNTQIFASDLSVEALALARGNAERQGVSAQITFVQGDLISPLVRFGLFDVLASNPPYIAPQEIETLEPEVRDWEPHIALGTNPDPLHFYRRLAADAPALLKPGGLLAVEVGQGQAEAVTILWTQLAALENLSITKDYAGIARIVTGQKRTV